MSGRWPAVVLTASLVSLGAASAFSQTFADAGGLSDALARIGAGAAALRAQPLRPAAAPAASGPRHGVMGASRFEDGGAVASQSLPPDPFGAAELPDVSRYAVRGVDISHYEGDIAWDTVKLDGLSFVYIKATEGGDGVDEKFAANW
ncbi:MAG: hypothetical protein KGJ84_07895, partial [Elusimicrobia bacterium]|nr:hypothetical protein [Elusimicrobiota bacterium]